MNRLCERPGCSEAAAVAYGMRPEDLVFWLDVIPSDGNSPGGVLCLRHADSMVVPRNWTLDDLRDPELHLFRPPTIRRAPAPRTRRSQNVDPTGEQLRLEIPPSLTDDPTDDALRHDPIADVATTEVDATDVATNGAVTPGVVTSEVETPAVASHPAGDDQPTDDDHPAAEVDPADDDLSDDGSSRPDQVADHHAPWKPDFDARSDLDGLLSARSPLLARAFRGDHRRR